MKAKYEELSGFSADNASDIGIRLKVLAYELSSLDAGVDFLMEQAFPDTATGAHLDMHARTRGLTRKAAVPSRGELRFSRETALAERTVIPAGTVCATRGEDGLRFETAEEASIEPGEYHVSIPARSVESGSAHNVAPDSVGLILTPVPGVTSVTNTQGFLGGEDAESDESLRARLLSGYLEVSNGANAAFYRSLAMKHEGISSVNVLPRERGRGTVDVVVAGSESDPPPELVEAIETDMALAREINVDVSVYAAQARVSDVSVEVGVGASENFSDVQSLCETAVRGCFRSAKVGEPLRLCELGAAIYSVPGVLNYAISSPEADIRPTAKQIARLGSLSVTRMEVV